MAMRLPLFDPDPFLQRTAWLVAPVFTRLAAVLWLRTPATSPSVAANADSPAATPASEPLLDRLMGHALNYYEDFVKPTKSYRAPDDREKAALLDLAGRLRALPADTTDGELIQGEVYAVGKAHAFEPLRAWFGALYEVLLGASLLSGCDERVSRTQCPASRRDSSGIGARWQALCPFVIVLTSDGHLSTKTPDPVAAAAIEL